MKILKIIPATKIPFFQDQILTYFSPDEVRPGSLTLVNLKTKKVLGLVVEARDLREAKMSVKYAAFKLKKIDRIVSNQEIIDERLRNLLSWTSSYYWEPLGVVFKSILLHTSLKKWRELSDKGYKGHKGYKGQMGSFKKYFYSEIAQKELKVLFKRHLKRDEQILILYPEIAKLEKAAHELSHNFKDKIIIFHSDISAKKAWQNWQKVWQGEPAIILATRQGVFLPFKNLSLILVNEEESLSYKSWDQHPKINARHVALKLAEIHGAEIIFTSLAPSLETYWNIREKRYRLKSSIFKSSISKISVADMKALLENEKEKFSYFSPRLTKEIAKTLGKKEKVLLFQNRRGGATYIFCQDCGYFYQCPQCQFSLVYHRRQNKLLCHWCSYKENPPEVCRKCKSYRLKYAGRGTEKIYQEIKVLFPQGSVYILDSDIAPTYKEKLKILDDFKREKRGSILVATSAILGLPLDDFELSAFLNFDLVLNFPDFATREHVLQLTKKIADVSRTVILQTYNPDESLLQMIIRGKYDKIYHDEINLRKKLNYPPFWQIVNLKYKHRDEKKVKRETSKFYETLKESFKNDKQIQILGPLPPFREKIKNYHYRSIVLKVKRGYIKERNQILKFVPTSWDVDVEAIEI